jgi:isoquinoline 1-oxidoreductase
MERERSVRIAETDGRCGTDVTRRDFLGMLGAGLLITVTEGVSFGQRGGRGGSSMKVAARLHINADGTITVMTGKVEEGQGARAELTQAAAEEMRVGAEQIRLVMADTALVPDDGITAGSRTTPSTVPAVRRGAATARVLLAGLAAKEWGVDAGTLEVKGGRIRNVKDGRTVTYGDLANRDDIEEVLGSTIASDVELTRVERWEVMGTSVARANNRDIVRGGHGYPSDIVREGMLYGKVLRAPCYGAQLESIDLSAVEAMKDVVVLREGDFVGFAAKTSYRSAQACDAAAKGAKWKKSEQVSEGELFSHLKKTAREGGRGSDSFADAEGRAKKVLSEVYRIAYVQHAPMEPRAATAEWKDGDVTVWAGVDWPQRGQRDVAGAMGIGNERVRVIVPDMGGGFGGKHSAEAAVEAARLAKAAGKPVAVRWTREEEFKWAYFRPAALIECKGALDDKGMMIGWDFVNINAGGSGIDAPYRIANKNCRSVNADSPLRQGSYRCLAATGNNFARESFIDELADAAGADPLEFRLRQLDNERIAAVVEEAARRFGFVDRWKKKAGAGRGVGIACGTEKNSVVAACVEVEVNLDSGDIKPVEICEVFECGPIQNPANLLSQVQGCIMMGLGPALREEMHFADGVILNAEFAEYAVPRFADVPKMDVHLLNKKDIDSAGGGETPIIAIAPAIGNAVFHATGMRIRSMPMIAEMKRQLGKG